MNAKVLDIHRKHMTFAVEDKTGSVSCYVVPITEMEKINLDDDIRSQLNVIANVRENEEQAERKFRETVLGKLKETENNLSTFKDNVQEFSRDSKEQNERLKDALTSTFDNQESELH